MADKKVKALGSDRTGIAVRADNEGHVQVLWDDDPDGRRQWHAVATTTDGQLIVVADPIV